MPVIKRYSNRKLYDTEAKRYITLQGIAELIRRGDEVHVVDHESGDDITALIQAQTIFELERKLKRGLPGSVLTNLIRAGGDTLSQLRQVLSPADWRERIDAEIERRMKILIERGEVTEAEGLTLLGRILGVNEPDDMAGVTDEELEHALAQRGVPGREELEQLERTVQRLADELDQYSSQAAPRRRKPLPPRHKSQSRKKASPHPR